MANLVRRDPLREMVSLRDAMERLFEDSIVSPFGRWPLQANEVRTLALDMYETDDNLVVEASLPGISPDEVDISIVGNTLTIKGDIEQEAEEDKGKYYCRERHYRAFHRSVNLPTEVSSDKAEATFENGVLKLTLPKVEEAKPRKITIKTK